MDTKVRNHSKITTCTLTHKDMYSQSNTNVRTFICMEYTLNMSNEKLESQEIVKEFFLTFLLLFKIEH
jgi:hypothetical protein